MAGKHRWLYRRFAWRDPEARRIVAAIRAQEILDDLERIRARRARVIKIREARKKFLGVTKLREQRYFGKAHHEKLRGVQVPVPSG